MNNGQFENDRPRLRADALRNRNRILQVATQHFSAAGIGASLEEIAKAAGVGPGTLYRHFPSREVLLAAALQDRQTQLLRRSEEARKVADPDLALGQWLRALQDFLQTFTGLPASVLAAIKENASPLALSREALLAITGEFLERAQGQGCARRSVSANELFLGALAISWALDRVEAFGTTRSALEQLFTHGYLPPPSLCPQPPTE